MTSENMAEQSKMKLSFLATRQTDDAAYDVRDRLSRTNKLPVIILKLQKLMPTRIPLFLLRWTGKSILSLTFLIMRHVI